MSQPYPDPPMTTPLDTEQKLFMPVQWSKWFQGLRVLVNRLSVGQNINGTFHSSDGKTVTVTNGVITSIV